MFNLETAIQTLLHNLRLEHTLDAADVEELEDHLRHHVDDLVARGNTREDAFREASSRLGSRFEISDAYRDVFWEKARFRNRLWAALSCRTQIARHYLVMAVRSVRRRKMQAALNVMGLALAFASCLVIGLYVQDELSFDDFHSRADRVYRVSANWDGDLFANSAMRIAPMLTDEFPEIESSVRLYRTEKLLRYEDSIFEIKDVFYADSTLWNVFDFELKAGDEPTALAVPGSIVLTESIAHQLFGNADPIGKSVVLDNDWSAEVTGVVADASPQSHIQYSAFLSMTTAERDLPADQFLDWFWTSSYTYVALSPGSDPAHMSARFEEVQENHMGADSRELGMYYDLELEPLNDVYLSSDSQVPIGPTGSVFRVRIFLSVGVLILLLAGFNFTNLATAGSIVRAREIGVRKSFGAYSRQLGAQFLTESVVTSAVSMSLALVIVLVSIERVSVLSGKTLSMATLFDLESMLAIVSGTLFVGIAAGFFPAFVLSRTRASSVLKGVLPAIGSGKRLRHVLVITQFTVAIVLVAGTLMIRQQLEFVRDSSLGITEADVLVIDTGADAEIQQSMSRIKEALLADPAVVSVTASSDHPGSNRNSSRTVVEDSSGEMKVNFSKLYFVDDDFLKTYDLEIVEGRNFSSEFPSDSTSAMLINEQAARSFAFNDPSEAIGKRYLQWGKEGVIVGVFKDFNFTSLHSHIRALSMRIDPDENRYVSVRLNSAALTTTVARLESIWDSHVAHRPFSFRFLDDRLNALYAEEQRFSGLISLFAMLATLVGCLGLFGLTSIMAEQRFKEIGIRKAMGATVSQVVMLLSRETTALVGLAFLIASPIVWILGNRWLQNFYYRIDLPWSTILLTGLIAFLIGWATISHSVSRAARANPVDALQGD